MSQPSKSRQNFRSNGEVVPMSEDLPVEKVTSATIVRVPEYPVGTSNGSVHQRRSSLVSKRRPSRMSMDLSAAGSLSFHNINYTVGGRGTNPLTKYCRCPCIKPQPERQILFDVSVVFTRGMNAIMGPSGCGKSSLLDILADRKDPQGLSGQVLVDGLPPPPSFKYIVGYVVQDDIISGALSVRENLMFSANVRLPAEITTAERAIRVTKVIQDLSLESCADTKVGSESIRGISGGERKRACIGMELVLTPKILFLDEPTTGLDASTARNVMQCLSNLSKQGKTIVFSIHQPRYSTFKLFDTVLFLCQGITVYRGPAGDVVPYFARQGYQCEMYDNPADFALDTLIDAGRTPGALETLNNTYRATPMHTSVISLVDERSRNNDLEIVRRREKGAAARSIGAEIFYVAQRTARNTVRSPELFLSQTMISIIFGLLVGLVFFDLQKTVTPGIQDRFGTLFFIVLNQIFSSLSSLEPLLRERVLFVHENISGYYRIFTFFIAKLICDLLPLRVLPSILFSIIAYFMTGLSRTAGQFFVFLLTIFTCSVFGSSVGFFMAATFGTFAVANIVVVLIFILMMVFSGFLIDLASVFVWLRWIQWVSAFRYALNVVVINEFRGNITFCFANASNVCPTTGSDVLDQRNLDHATDWDMWKNYFALCMMVLTFLTLTYIQLVRIKKTK